MFTKLEKCLDKAIHDVPGDWRIPFYFQGFPMAGAFVSIPTAIVSTVLAVASFAKGVLEGIRGRDSSSKFNEAKSYSIISINNIANMCTLGILNAILIDRYLRKVYRSIRAEWIHG